MQVVLTLLKTYKRPPRFLNGPLDCPSGDGNVHFTTRSTYHIQKSYRVATTLMQTAHWLLDTEADVNFIQASKTPANFAYSIKRDGLPTLRTATEQPLSLDRLILMNLNIGDHNALVYLGTAPQLADDILLGAVFIDRFIHGIFWSERRTVL